jgi:hypothetical protein
MLRSQLSFGLFLVPVLALAPAVGNAGHKPNLDDFHGNTVSVIETNTGVAIATISLSGDGKTAYVTREGSREASVVELTTGKPATIAVGNYTVVVRPRATVTPATPPPDYVN